MCWQLPCVVTLIFRRCLSISLPGTSSLASCPVLIKRKDLPFVVCSQNCKWKHFTVTHNKFGNSVRDEIWTFIFRWPCISLQFFANDQLGQLFCIFIYYKYLHVSSITVLIIRRSNCINTSSGMIRSSLLTGIPSSHSHRLIIPDDVLIQLNLLMMSTWCSKHVEIWNE